MAEMKAFVCDSGCGEHIQLRHTTESPTDLGWFVVYRPRGQGGAAHFSSASCLHRWLNRQYAVDRELREGDHNAAPTEDAE